MLPPERSCLLRIFLGESDRYRSEPAYQAIVLRARERHIRGATVLRGCMGYGVNSRLHTAKILRLSEDLPMVIEIIDAKETIEAFIPTLREIAPEALVTMEMVTVLQDPTPPHAAKA